MYEDSGMFFVLVGICLGLYSIWLLVWPILMYNRMNRIIKLLDK